MAAHVEGKEYDVIFAGGGTAGCVAASRLAQANPSLSILIIERGKSSFENPLVANPGLTMTHLVPQVGSLHPQVGNKSAAANGREIFLAAPSILGGGSSVNIMMYSRASGVDFDDWKTEGWDAKSLVPYAKRAETFHPSGPGYNKDVHGYDGPINVSHGPYSSSEERQRDLLDSLRSQGIEEVPDVQDFESGHGACRWARYIGLDGKRSDVPSAYLLPLIRSGNHPNLHILTETTVRRVHFTGTHASAVECEPSSNYRTEAQNRKPHQIIKAKKYVIVSAGALSTPSILERSGVGCADRLRKLEIPVVSDLRGVGDGYQDHQLVIIHFTSRIQKHESLDTFWPAFTSTADALSSQSPLLSWNGMDVGAKMRLSDAEVDSLGPAFREAYDRDFKNKSSKPFAIMGCLLGWLSPLPNPTTDADQFVTIAPFSLYPWSRGAIHIASSDPYVPASCDPGYLDDELDVKTHIICYKKAREFARRTNFVTAEHKPSHPNFHPDSPAARLFPDDATAAANPRFRTPEERAALPPIQYSPEDDKAIEQHVRDRVNSMWHSLGTAKMAPRDECGVVDPRLNVYGTTGLKIVDLSICPGNIGGNTANTAIIIGEKAGDLLAEELGLTVA